MDKERERLKDKAEMFERHYITMRNALIEIYEIAKADGIAYQLDRCYVVAKTALDGHVEFDKKGEMVRDRSADH